MADKIIEVREGRPLERSLQRVEGAPSELIALQHCVQLLALLLGQPLEHPRKQPPVHGATNVGRQRIECAERRQFEALTHKVFDGNIDQIRRVVHHLGGLVHCQDRCMTRFVAPGLHLKWVRICSWCRYSVRGVTSSAVSDGSRKLDRTWVTTANGASCKRGRWPRRWNTFRSTASVRVDDAPRAVARMKAKSATVGVYVHE
jgi:hypothetical protein